MSCYMQSLEVSKTRGKNKKNFEKCWLSIINKGNISKFSYFFPLFLKLQVTVLYVRRNFKNVTIDLAIHSHSAQIYRLQCISIARKKSYINVKNTWQLCRFFFYLSLKYISYVQLIYIHSECFNALFNQ
jgi:hypothetical protein